MSLQNLGKVQSVLEFLEQASNSALIKPGEVQASAKFMMSGIKIKDAAKALKSLGVDDITDTLVRMGYGADKASEAVQRLNQEGASLGNMFKGLGNYYESLHLCD